MEQDIFYETDKLTYSKKKKLLHEAHSICDKWWFDKLDCSESFARQKIENITFEEAMGHFSEQAFMVVIQRNQIFLEDEKPYLEVGFSSMESPVDYFLWIIVSLRNSKKITKGMAVRF